MIHSVVSSPIGDLLLVGDGRALHRLHMLDGPPRTATPRDDEAFAAVRAQLAEYFAGERRTFEIELAMDGTSFQRTVWEALRRIPYGETTSYGELARSIGKPDAFRAVGAANGSNPIAVIVPCHRVIGANGGLTGFGGGLDRKRTLLDLECGVVPLI